MSTAAHWGYGTGLGALRGLLAGTPLSAKAANLLFFTGVSAAPMAYLPALGVAPPPTQWGPKQIVTDTAHHLVYAAAVAAAWRLLTKSSPIRSGKGLFGW
ncbi:MAG: hypothetical protein M3349_05535 [Actinomycetota bacterium]|nr:hypothetical protein [Actinomycetota bacterium]